jgi:hypothetical protein
LKPTDGEKAVPLLLKALIELGAMPLLTHTRPDASMAKFPGAAKPAPEKFKAKLQSEGANASSGENVVYVLGTPKAAEPLFRNVGTDMS